MKKKFAIEHSGQVLQKAYHGTSKETARKILKEKKFVPTRDARSYLGDGVYFYEHSRWLAANWAEKCLGKGACIGIICACIDYGYCLNLDIPEHRQIIRRVKDLISIRDLQAKKLDRVTDSFVINYYSTNIAKNIDTVRLTYMSDDYKKMMFPGSLISDYRQPMVCVRKQDKISKICIAFEGSDYHE